MRVSATLTGNESVRAKNAITRKVYFCIRLPTVRKYLYADCSIINE